MGLLKFHFAFSVLCMLTIFGFFWTFLKKIRENGWGRRVEGGPLKRFLFRLRGYLYFVFIAFVPVLNVLTPWVLYYLARHKAAEQEAP